MAAHGAHNNDPVDYIWDLIVREGRLPGAGGWHIDAAFKRYALGRPAFNQLLPDPFYAEELTDDQRRQLKAVLSRIERFGQAVRGTLPLGGCLPGLMDQLALWLEASIAPVWRASLGPAITQNLAGRLRQSIRSYAYDVDFWAWAQPILVDELLQNLAARGVCAGDILEQLTQDAERCLAEVNRTHGVYGVWAQMVAARAVLIVLRASEPISMATARVALRAEVKRFAVQAALPVMDWSRVRAGNEDAEYRKRIKLLEAFNGLVRG